MDKRLVGLMVVFFLSFTIFAATVVFRDPLSRLIRAKEEFIPSPKDSLMVAWPLSLPADGKTESVINVFLRSSVGRPIKKKQVFLTTTLGRLRESQVETNDEGKASFYLSSETAGVAEIEAMVDGDLKLVQKLTIRFE